MAKPVRTTIDPSAGPPQRRSVDDRLVIRWPGLFRATTRFVSRLPPRSRVRRALLRRGVVTAWGAWSRDDLDLLVARMAPDWRFDPVPDMLGPGMRRSYEGHGGLRELSADWREAWAEMGVAPREILDFGDRLITVGEGHVRARDTGIEFRFDVFSAMWIEAGLVVRQADFRDREEALRAIDAATLA